MLNLGCSGRKAGICIVAPQIPPCDRILIADIILQSYNAANGEIRIRSHRSSFRANGSNKHSERPL